MKESEGKIKGFTSRNKSRHFDSSGLSIMDAIRCLADDDDAVNQYRHLFRQKQHFITEDIKAKNSPKKSEALEQEFDKLIKEWVSAIKYKSLESQQINHPAFLRTIALGDKFLPFVFEEFSKRPFMAWLKALPAIVGCDVASEAKSFPEAVKLWKEWGKENGYLPQ